MRPQSAFWAALGLLLACAPAGAERLDLRIERCREPIRVDGSLSDPGWAGVTPVEAPFETYPGDNQPAPVKTEYLLAHDDHNLYVGIRAHDPDPSKIRAHYSDRDRAYSDDFAGIVLDTFNDERRAFEFFVNPLGVQMDLVQNDASGGNEDDTWDTIWSSAGRITAEGYVVELAIPFSSLRFQRTEAPQTWGVDFIRIYPRSQRLALRSQPQDRNRNCYLCQVSKVTGFAGVSPGRNLEVAPTLTLHRTDAREPFPEGSLGGGAWNLDPGLSAKWGFTPNLTLNAAANPDFSQVEADSAQLDVNSQFALFYDEKRPLFLEGSDYFSTSLTAVYTRTIADPDWGIKLTGKEGRSAVGLFAARDTVTNLLLPGPEGSDLTSLPEANLSTALRYRYDVGGGSTVGVLYTGRSGGDYRNHVVGLDTYLRLTPKDSLGVQVLGSSTRYPSAMAADFDQPEDTFGDRAFLVSYRHSTRNYTLRASYEDRGDRFRADLGFIPRVNYRQPILGGSYTIWGKPGSFCSRLSFGGDWDRTDKETGGKLEEEWEGFVEANLPLQAYVSAGGGTRETFLQGARFRQAFGWAYAEIRPSGLLYASLDTAFGDQLDYANVRNGKRLFLRPGVDITPGRHLRLQADHTYDRLDVDGGRLFTANLTQVRLTYNVSTRLLFRAIAQVTRITRARELYTFEVDAETKRVFTQLLASYKLNAQTVVFLGYSDNSRGDERVDLTRADRTVFAKVGYAWVP